MKKTAIFIAIAGIILTSCIYIFIPGKLTISRVQYANCNVNGAARVLATQKHWDTWWPGKRKNTDTSSKATFQYRTADFQITEKLYNGLKILIADEGFRLPSTLSLVKINTDSTALFWTCHLSAGNNPIARLMNFRKAETVRGNMDAVLSALCTFLGDKKNIYGIRPYISMSKDSTMVAVKTTTDHYPTVPDIYTLINSLDEYISTEKAEVNNFPMLNVKTLGDHHFETMVAIPVNRELRGNGKVFFSRFVPWKVLTADVKGGDHTINEALRQMRIYMSDYQIIQMAIPFQSLVTNRLQEPDTSKWFTRIYTPVP